MKILNSLASAGLMLTMLGAVSVRANDITYAIQGTVQETLPLTTEIAVGETYTMTVTSDPDSLVSISDGKRYPISSGNITFSGGYAGQFDPLLSSVEVVNTTTTDLFTIKVTGGTFPDGNGYPFGGLFFPLGDSTGTALESDALPTALNLSDFSSTRSFIF